MDTESFTQKYAKWSSLSNLRKECVRLAIQEELVGDSLQDTRTKLGEAEKENRALRGEVKCLHSEIEALKKELLALRPAEQPTIVETITVSEMEHDLRFGPRRYDTLIVRDSESRFYELVHEKGQRRWERLPPILPPLDLPEEGDESETEE